MTNILEESYGEIVFNEAIKRFNETVAIFPGAFKPPHAGHFDIIQKYAKKADTVYVLISNPVAEKSQRKTKNGTVITPEMSKEILDLYVHRYNLGRKVKVEISAAASPIEAAYTFVDEQLHDCNVIFCASTKGDDYKRFAGGTRYFKDREDLNILDPKLTAVQPFTNKGVAISATDIRNRIDDKEFLKTVLPEKLTSKDINKIMRILSANPTTYESRIKARRNFLKEGGLDKLEDVLDNPTTFDGKKDENAIIGKMYYSAEHKFAWKFVAGVGRRRKMCSVHIFKPDIIKVAGKKKYGWREYLVSDDLRTIKEINFDYFETLEQAKQSFDKLIKNVK